MSKYIIEIAEEYEEYFKGVLICGIADGKFAVDVIAREDLEELNSDYINKHYGELQDDAYKRDYEDGKNSIDMGCEGCKYSLRFAKDEPCKSCSNCYKSKYEPMPQQDDRIEVGDEVEWEGVNFTVLRVFTPKGCYEQCDGFDSDGNGYTNILTKDVTKTGKHYDIQSILEAMRK